MCLILEAVLGDCYPTSGRFQELYELRLKNPAFLMNFLLRTVLAGFTKCSPPVTDCSGFCYYIERKKRTSALWFKTFHSDSRHLTELYPKCRFPSHEEHRKEALPHANPVQTSLFIKSNRVERMTSGRLSHKQLLQQCSRCCQRQQRWLNNHGPPHKLRVQLRRSQVTRGPRLAGRWPFTALCWDAECLARSMVEVSHLRQAPLHFFQ